MGMGGGKTCLSPLILQSAVKQRANLKLPATLKTLSELEGCQIGGLKIRKVSFV